LKITIFLHCFLFCIYFKKWKEDYKIYMHYRLTLNATISRSNPRRCILAYLHTSSNKNNMNHNLLLWKNKKKCSWLYAVVCCCFTAKTWIKFVFFF
jgi:hypothetical protein